METFLLPELIRDVYTFYERTNELFLGIQPSIKPDEEVSDLLGSRGAEHFTFVLKDGSDSLICFWRLPDAANPPVVWLDSEGSPVSVFANSTADLLSLLCYDTGFIVDALVRCEARGVTTTKTIQDDLEFPDEQLQEYLDGAESRYPGYGAFREWLEREHGITPMNRPVTYVATTLLKYPSLESWLGEQGLW